MGYTRCYVCKKEFSNSGMTRHLKSCLVKNEGYKAAGNFPDPCFMICVKDIYEKDYSLYLMVDSCVRLNELDQYLRDIWLECCGHLSHFEINGEYYESNAESYGEHDMDEETGNLFYPGLVLTYEYDYGSTTCLTISVEGAYQPSGNEAGIRLLARNKPVEHECEQCEKPAEYHYFNPYVGECGVVCSSCRQEMEQKEEDEEDEIDFSGIINSPRFGVCDYEGPSIDIPFMRHKPRKTKKNNKNYNMRNPDSNKGLEFLESLLAGNTDMDVPEAEQLLKNIMSRFKEEEPFVLLHGKLKEKTYACCLMLLKKYELDLIRKNLSIRVSSNSKKQELAECIEKHVRQSFNDILTYISYDDFHILQEICREETFYIDDDEGSVEAIRFLLRKGLVFAIRHPLEKIEAYFPLREDFLQITASSEFMKKRDFINQMEQCINSIFFYWGVAELGKIMTETARLMNVPEDEQFSLDFHGIMSHIDVSILKYELIGHTRYYYVYSDYPAEQVISNTWQESEYPALSMDMVPERADLLSLIMHHLHFRLLFELFYELYSEEGQEDLDEETESDEEDEDLYRVEALETTAIMIEKLMNGKPDTTVKELFEGSDLPDYLWSSQDFIHFMNDLKEHAPNYWMKGNSLAGKMYFTGDSPELLKMPWTKPDKRRDNPMDLAAERWKVGRNDPCPCGSGKKYKKCCMNKE